MTAIIEQQWQDAIDAAAQFDKVSCFSESRALQMTKRDVHRWLRSAYLGFARRFGAAEWTKGFGR